MTRIRLARIALLVMAAAACHKAPEVKPAPAAPVDNGAAERAAAAERARRDSIARADAARRDSIARADADRRAREAAAAAAAERARNALSTKIYFEFDTDSLSPAAVAALDAKVPVLRDHPSLRVRIEGNADDRGSDEYNMVLGQKRSATARRYLVARGIAEARIDVVSFGEQRPACSADDDSCWRQNRRDEFVLTAGAESLNRPH